MFTGMCIGVARVRSTLHVYLACCSMFAKKRCQTQLDIVDRSCFGAAPACQQFGMFTGMFIGVARVCLKIEHFALGLVHA